MQVEPSIGQLDMWAWSPEVGSGPPQTDGHWNQREAGGSRKCAERAQGNLAFKAVTVTCKCVVK